MAMIGTSAQNIVDFIVADVDLVTYFAATVIPDAIVAGLNIGENMVILIIITLVPTRIGKL